MTDGIEKPCRRWFAFSLRTLFVLSERSYSGTFHSLEGVGRPPWSIRILGEPGINHISFYAAPDTKLESFDFPPGIHELFPEAVIGIYSVGPRPAEPNAPSDGLVAPGTN